MDVGQDLPHFPLSAGSSLRLSLRWPARAQDLLSATLTLCIDHLHEPLRACLGQFEQQMFAQADHAHGFGDQQRLFSVRERMMTGRAAIEQRFLEHLTHQFEQIDAAAADTRNTGNTWHALELMDPVEQELATTLEQLGARGEGRHANMLHEIGYRIAVLIGAPPLDGEGLPVGPHALVQAFHAASLPLELPLELQVQLLRGFDRSVIHTLMPLYEAVNTKLRDDGILPQLRSTPLPRHMANRPHAIPTEPTATETEEGHRAATASAPIEVLESLRNLLARQRASVGDSPLHGVIDRAASTDELQTALSALQQHFTQVTDQASRELRSAARLREELLAQLNAGKSADAPRTQLSGEQGDTVELVAMLFEQLAKQLQHGGSANALLSNLQLPVLRMAVADHDFFEQHEHPARQLLDTVTAAANDWLDGSDDDASRLLASKLERLVSRASEEPPSSALYTVLLADIEHHLAVLNRKARAAERRHIEAAQGRERLDAARDRATKIMAERFAQSPPRGLLRALLERAWSDVLALTLLRHGEDSDAFGNQLTITDQLLGRLPVGDRKHLQQDVEAGLQQIGMHTEEAIQVAQRLLGVPVANPGVDQPSTTDLALRLKQHQRLGEPASGDTSAPAPVPSTSNELQDPREILVERHLRQLPFGTWFEFDAVGEGVAVRRKLAWYSPMSGRCLLVTRRGQRTDDLTLAQLAREIAHGRVHEAQPEHGSLLDSAWRSLTGALRQVSSRPSTRAESNR